MTIPSPPELSKLRQAFSEPGPEALPCPSADRIFAAAHGELRGSDLDEILDHVAVCASCTQAWHLALEIRKEIEGLAAPTLETGNSVVVGRFGAKRWSQLLGTLAAILLMAVLLPHLVPNPVPVDESVVRGEGEVKIRDVSGPLQRERCVLRWQLEPPVPGARFEVTVMDENLQPLARHSALTVNELVLLPEDLKGVAPGGALHWRVQATLPDGRQVGSNFQSRAP